jgi:pimeloyl-ACP methyl ester carboxylesterase
MTNEYADVNGVTLHYVRAGNGDKLIMFIHGFPEFWYAFEKQLEEFNDSDRYTAIALDMRGYNLSSKPAEIKAYQVKQMVEDLRQLAEKLGFKKFSLVAHDWGGGIAWWFAIVHPGYVDKLIIINAPHPAVFKRLLKHNIKQLLASSYMLFFQSSLTELVLSMFNYRLLVNAVLKDGLRTGYFNEADKQAYLKAWSQPGALTGGLNYYRAAAKYGTGLNNSTYNVTVPTLVIWGEKDKYLRSSNLVGLEKYVTDLTIKKVSEGSHWVIHKEPKLVHHYIKEFLG